MLYRVIRKTIDFINPWEDYTFGAARPFRLEWFKSLLKKAVMWSFRETAIRYLPVIYELKRSKHRYANILDVGSGALGLSQYIKRNVVGVDLSPRGPRYPNITLVKVDARRLPFGDRSFDLVICIDMLEHMDGRAKVEAINELLRVARKKIIIGVPCGPAAEKIEEKVRVIYGRILERLKHSNPAAADKLAARSKFLYEHLSAGLPSEEDMLRYIDDASINCGSNVIADTIKNESVYVWCYWVLGYIKYSYLRCFLTTLIFIILFPIIARVKWGGYYRKLFFIEKTSQRV